VTSHAFDSDRAVAAEHSAREILLGRQEVFAVRIAFSKPSRHSGKSTARLRERCLLTHPGALEKRINRLI